MPTPRTEGSHERDSGIKKAEISEWARDDQGLKALPSWFSSGREDHDGCWG